MDIEKLLLKSIRIGRVTQIYEDEGTVRVQYLDLDGQVSGKLKVLQKNTLKNFDYWLPDVDELVVVLHFPSDNKSGVILGSFYTESITVPIKDKNTRRVEFEDGTIVEYNRAEHKLIIDVQGEVACNIEKETNLEIKDSIVCDLKHDVTLDIAGELKSTIKKDMTLEVNGSVNLVVNGDVKIEGKSILLGGSMAIDPLIKGNLFKITYTIDNELLKNHTHDLDMQKMKTKSSSELSGLQGMLDTHLSSVVKTS